MMALRLQPIAVAVSVVRVTAKQEGSADEEATVMEVVEIVMVETMVEFMRGKSRTKTAADKPGCLRGQSLSYRRSHDVFPF